MFSVEQRGEDVVVTPQCDLDLATKEIFVKCLETAANTTTGRVVVSMLHCDYVDSTALNALAVARRSLDGRLVLAVPPGIRVARVFQITNFDKVVPIFPTLDEALAKQAS